MVKAGGSSLTFDQFNINPINFFINPSTTSLFKKQNHHHHHKLPKHLINSDLILDSSMTSSSTTTNTSNIEFSMMNYNSSTTDDLDQDHNINNTTRSINEMDFFSDNNNKIISSLDIKKEDHSNGAGLSFTNVNTGLKLLTANTVSDQSTVDDDGISPNGDDKQRKNELESLQTQLDEMNLENQKLKGMLNQITHDYNLLQMNLVAFMQQQQNPKIESSQDHHHEMNVAKQEEKKDRVSGSSMVPRQFMELGLATTHTETDQLSNSSSERKSDRSLSPQNNTEVVSKSVNNTENNRLDQEKSNLNNQEETQNHSSQGWVPNKVPKMSSSSENVEQPMEATMRKARVSVRARSEAPMISDGCQWRKYGQKLAKGNPCPRAYYRCTMATGCPVRKQVQRCVEDKTVLTTTYEGTHNHPLPPAAMAMAATTSQAVSMLLSGSMSSADGLMNSNFSTRALLPCSPSMATISASAPFPTVTLDLTRTPNPLQFQRPPTQQPPQFHLPFMNSQPPPPPQSFGPNQPVAGPPQIFGQSLYNQSKFSGLQMSSQNIDQGQLLNHQPPLVDSVNALTSNPNFTAALVAAISSIMSNGGHQTNNNANNSSNKSPSYQQ